jgi:surfeit locus 1 family protein
VEFSWNGAVAEQRTQNQAAVLPFSIDAEAEPANPGGWPKPTPTEIRLSNRHLEYVVTWWGLALTLFVVYALYARQRLRRTAKSPSTT